MAPRKISPNPTETIEQMSKRILSKALVDFCVPLIANNPNDPRFPLSILLIASAKNGAGTQLQWVTTADATIPDQKPGYPHAMCMTRDLLLLCQRMSDDFGLGLTLLPAVLAQHPAVLSDAEAAKTRAVKPMAEPHVETIDGKRVVHDLIEAKTETASGAGNARKH